MANPEANILVVDDKPANLHLLVAMLSRQGYRVRPVRSGKLALSSVNASPPDLILLDINMPEMNGYEVCRVLKESEMVRDIPVIFISALDEVLDKVEAFKVGGVDYITKPFQVEEVLARIKTHLALRNLQKEIARQLEEQRRLNEELRQALEQVKTLSGLIPICASCKNIRDDEGFWHDVEVYIEDHSEANFSHGICPACKQKLYPQFSKPSPEK